MEGCPRTGQVRAPPSSPGKNVVGGPTLHRGAVTTRCKRLAPLPSCQVPSPDGPELRLAGAALTWACCLGPRGTRLGVVQGGATYFAGAVRGGGTQVQAKGQPTPLSVLP